MFAAFVAVYVALRLAIDLLGIRRYLRRLELGTAFALWFVGEIFRASVGVARIVLGRGWRRSRRWWRCAWRAGTSASPPCSAAC